MMAHAFVSGSIARELAYSLTITGVSSGVFSKKCRAIRAGKRMQPCEARNLGT